MRIRRLVFLVICLVPLPAYADVTLRQTTAGTGSGLSARAKGTTYIRGNKMRADTIVDDKTQTTIVDIDAQKIYSFDSKKKEADVWDMATIAAEVSKSVDVSSTRASLKPNGQTKRIGGRAVNGYDMDVLIQSSMGGRKDVNMSVSLSGPVWIVENAPGSADFAHFYTAALAKGWTVSDPRGAKARPAQAKTIAEMYRKIAQVAGIPYEIDVQIKMSGGGPLAELALDDGVDLPRPELELRRDFIGGQLAKMGNVTMTTTVESTDVGPLAESLFAPPADYKLNQKR
jgi:hypothetical protein